FEFGYGACGYTDEDSKLIIAISSGIFGTGGHCSQVGYLLFPQCGRWIGFISLIPNTDNGNSAYGKTRDKCESCSSTILDMSPGLFEQLSTLNTGEIPISWVFMNDDWSP
ncbi:uncharacterized protein EDB91DRAFT_1048860, partial [Suillus paluster]|uniref:uncharacterized protein n=1 Tax=Suillus paluster TaxID=48578 RepID=UPI001B86974E